MHGWIHEHLGVLNNEAEEQRLLNQSIDALTKAMGKRPVGYRAPSWAMSRFTMKQVKDAGFLYDSSLMASDDAYEVTIDGQASGVIELPIERILDDAPYYGAANGSLPSPELVDQIYRAEFDVAYREGGTVRTHDAPALYGASFAGVVAREADYLHEVEARGLVRHARRDCKVFEECILIRNAIRNCNSAVGRLAGPMSDS